MRKERRISSLGIALIGGATFLLAAAGTAFPQSHKPTGPAAVAQQENPRPPLHSLGDQSGNQQNVAPSTGGARALIETPVSGLFPGGISTRPAIKKPVGNDPAAAPRGMAYFMAFNCIGCHADNGGGGMGPGLSHSFFPDGGRPPTTSL